jgi:hypothetical protein
MKSLLTGRATPGTRTRRPAPTTAMRGTPSKVVRKLTLLAGVAATVTTVAVVAVPGIASADGTGDFCANTGYCLSMNGTTDNLVYAKLPQNDKQQTTAVEGYFGCTHAGQPSEYVQAVNFHGDTTNCPFTFASLDMQYEGDEIVTISNYSSNVNGERVQYYGSQFLRQEPPGNTGQEFIMAPNGLYVNVLASDGSVSQQPEFMCDTGRDNPIDVSTSPCSWFFR